MTTDDFRALCAELLAHAKEAQSVAAHGLWFGDEDDGLFNRADTALAEPQPPADGEVAELVSTLQFEADAESPATDFQWLTPDQLRRAADLLERRYPQPIPVAERLPENLIPVEYWDMESGARIVSEPCEDKPGGCWVVLNSRTVNPFAEYPTVQAAWEALKALPLPSGEVK